MCVCPCGRRTDTPQDQTIEELKEEISSNYTSFICASAEIKTMENSVSQLKTLVLECKRSLHTLKMVALETAPGARALAEGTDAHTPLRRV